MGISVHFLCPLLLSNDIVKVMMGNVCNYQNVNEKSDLYTVRNKGRFGRYC